MGQFLRARGKQLGQGHIHEVLAVPSGVLIHVHSTETAFDIVDGDTVERVEPTGVYSASVSLPVDTYLSTSNVTGTLQVVASTVVSGNGPKFLSEIDCAWVKTVELDLSGRDGFRVG